MIWHGQVMEVSPEARRELKRWGPGIDGHYSVAVEASLAGPLDQDLVLGPGMNIRTP
jgi:hypothetical protein